MPACDFERTLQAAIRLFDFMLGVGLASAMIVRALPGGGVAALGDGAGHPLGLRLAANPQNRGHGLRGIETEAQL